MRELIERIVKQMVTKPDEVKVQEKRGRELLFSRSWRQRRIGVQLWAGEGGQLMPYRPLQEQQVGR